jgi:hypothetical protein
VRTPDGAEWEIYAYKLQVGDRRDWDSDLVDPDGAEYPTPAKFAVVHGVAWLVMLVPRLIVRFRDAAVAAVRAVLSDEWTIEAITFVPQRQSYVWTTTTEHKGHVLAQVEGSLARGNPPGQLRNATYRGWRRSAR